MPHPLASAPNVNHLWAGLLVEELVRQGTTLFVVCPGSRSTPLAVAAGQNPRAEVLVHWDERAAAFVALGWGRATGRPAAVITTSGTAVANLLPAAVEADADGVPLMLLTADRPPELRETGANQTVRQPPVFQDVARWALDWPVPTPSVPVRWVLSTAGHAVLRAIDPPGPVHLNLPFREPLGAQPDGTDAAALLHDVQGWLDAKVVRGAPLPAIVTDATRYQMRHPADRWGPVVEWAERLRERGATRGVVVLGSGLTNEFNVLHTARRLAKQLRWPLLEDVLAGGGMGGSGASPAAPEFDLALTSRNQALLPTAVLHLGGRATSKRLLQWIDRAAPELYLHVRPDQARFDPDGRVTHHARAGASNALDRLLGLPAELAAPAEWLRSWRAASGAAYRTAQAEIDEAGLSEPYVARGVTRALKKGRAIVAAASMPIRDLEAYGDRMGPAGPVFANRGASGIDGTVATAHGVARGLGAPVALLIGDLALLHDQTSLALLREGPPVVVVVVNNDGGGIFHRLPIADGPGALAPDAFERFFGTPHGLGFAPAAAQVGLAYHAPTTAAAFDAALAEALATGASAVVEVRTDRAEQAALRRRIEAAVAAAVDRALVG